MNGSRKPGGNPRKATALSLKRGPHHSAESYLDAYLEVAALGDKTTPLFQTIDRGHNLTGFPITRNDVFRMIKRRAKSCGLPRDAPIPNPYSRRGR